MSDICLYELHLIIQYAMGWTESHLFEFNRGDMNFGARYPEIEAEFPDLIEALCVPVAGVLKRPGQVITYVYDLGDYWEHKVQLNRHLNRDPLKKYPVCVDGEGNCPPEDCGGIHGFYSMIGILNDSGHPDHKEMKRWVGKNYDPAAFNLSKTNTRMRRVKARLKEYSIDYYRRKYLNI